MDAMTVPVIALNLITLIGVIPTGLVIPLVGMTDFKTIIFPIMLGMNGNLVSFMPKLKGNE